MSAVFSHLRRPQVLLGVACLLLASLGTTARAQTPSYTVTGWSYPAQVGSLSGGPYDLGFTFRPNKNIEVTSLGEWFPGGQPDFSGSETVGIYDSNGLLFSATFTAANATLTSNTLADGSQFRYMDITSLFSQSLRTLQANTEYEVAGTFVNNTYATNALGLVSSPNITITSDGLYSYNGDNTTIIRPNGDAGYNMYGINFEYGDASGAAVAPEPSSLALCMGAVVAGGAFALRRRRKA